MNEVVTDAVDVRIDHQRINESEDQHDPERRVRIQKEEREEIREMEQTRERRDDIPARVGEKVFESVLGRSTTIGSEVMFRKDREALRQY